MRRGILTAVAATLVISITACWAPSPHDNSHHTDATSMAALDSLKQWLGYGPPSPNPQGTLTLPEWLEAVYEAICELEERTGVPPNQGLCVRDPGGDPDPTGGPPPSPPWD